LIVKGVKVGVYEGDFGYWQNGLYFVEDVKSPYTRRQPLYRLKKRLMLALYAIEIVEVI